MLVERSERGAPGTWQLRRHDERRKRRNCVRGCVVLLLAGQSKNQWLGNARANGQGKQL